MKKIAVIGAGITGLSCAYFLKKRGFEVEVFEAESKVGGWIDSQQEEGFFFERGPRGFRPSGKGEVILSLAKDLGIDSQLIFSSPKERYLYKEGKLYDSRRFWPLLLKGAWRDLWAARGLGDDESMASFFDRRVGRDLREALIAPMTLGIYGSDQLEQLSMQSCFSDLFDRERQDRSLVWSFLKGSFLKRSLRKKRKQPGGLASFKGGMRALVLALEKELGPAIHLKDPLLAFSKHKIRTASGESEVAGVVLTLGPSALARVEGAGADFEGFSSTSLGLIHLGFEKDPLPSGFGFLRGQGEQTKIIGGVFDSQVFREHNYYEGQGRVTLMFACESKASLVEEEKSAIYKEADRVLSQALGQEVQPIYRDCHIANKAIAAYQVGHQRWLGGVRDRLLREKGSYLVGASYTGVSVIDCVLAAEQVSKEISKI